MFLFCQGVAIAPKLVVAVMGSISDGGPPNLIQTFLCRCLQPLIHCIPPCNCYDCRWKADFHIPTSHSFRLLYRPRCLFTFSFDPGLGLHYAMFSFRRKSSKKGQDSEEDTQLKSSPSLPKLPSQGIPWPETLVDVAAIRQEPESQDRSPQGAAKMSFSTSLSGVDQAPVSFHKPFRGTSSIDGEVSGGTISSLYMSHPPSSFEIWKASPLPLPVIRPNQRRTRQPPTFNLMVRAMFFCPLTF